jgi:hypothetical protein
VNPVRRWPNSSRGASPYDVPSSSGWAGRPFGRPCVARGPRRAQRITRTARRFGDRSIKQTNPPELRSTIRISAIGRVSAISAARLEHFWNIKTRKARSSGAPKVVFLPVLGARHFVDQRSGPTRGQPFTSPQTTRLQPAGQAGKLLVRQRAVLRLARRQVGKLILLFSRGPVGVLCGR